MVVKLKWKAKYTEKSESSCGKYKIMKMFFYLIFISMKYEFLFADQTQIFEIF